MRGPYGRECVFDPATFVKDCSEFPAVLSLGWTTGAPPAAEPESKDAKLKEPVADSKGQQTYAVDEMIAFCKQQKLQQVTFPVRASSVRHSWSELKKLLTSSPNYSLTVWKGGAKHEKAQEAADRQWIVKNLPGDRTFVDMDS